MEYRSSSEEDDRDLPTKRRYDRRNNELDLTDTDFYERYRFTKRQFHVLHQRLSNRLLVANKNHALSSSARLLVALRFYASNAFYYGVGDMEGKVFMMFTLRNCLLFCFILGLAKSSTSRILRQVTNAILEEFDGIVAWPLNEDDRIRIAAGFFRKNRPGMPNVCGAIDGSLVPIEAPSTFENQFVDRHGTH